MAVELKLVNYGALDMNGRNVGTQAASDGPTAPETQGTVQTSAPTSAVAGLAASENDSLGLVPASTNAAPSPSSTVPELPDVEGSKASVSETLAVTNRLDAVQTFVSQPLSAAMIFNLLQRASQQAYEIAGSFNRIANRANIDAKTSEAAHLKQQVAAEREHANTALTGAVLGAAAGAFVGMKGASLSRSDAAIDSKVTPQANAPAAPLPQPHGAANPLDPAHAPAVRADGAAPQGPPGQVGAPPAGPANAPAPVVNHRRAAQPGRHDAAAAGQPNPPAAPAVDELSRRDLGNGISNMGQPISNVVTTAFDTYDKTSANGGQYQADQARIAQKNDTVDSAIAQTVVDTSKSSLDQATEGVKAAQQAIQSWAERQSQVINNIANR